MQTDAFVKFYGSVSPDVQEKIDYIVYMMEELTIVNSKFVKKLKNTDYYEMRISVGNEFRVVMFAIDHRNFSQATKILLLYGFLKKSVRDYKSQIANADK